MPTIVGHRLETALSMLSKYDFKIIIKETFGNKDIKTDEIRVIRQKMCGDNVLELVIAYF